MTGRLWAFFISPWEENNYTDYYDLAVTLKVLIFLVRLARLVKDHFLRLSRMTDPI